MIPRDIGERGRKAHEEREVKKDRGLKKRRKVKPHGGDKKDGRRRDEGPEKYFPGYVIGRALCVEVPDENRVYGPGESGEDCEEVAERIELEYEFSVENHEAGAREGKHRASDGPFTEPLSLEEKVRKDRGEDRRGRNEKRYVRGKGVIESEILREEIERTARDAGERKRDFRLKAFRPVKAGIEGEHDQICGGKAVDDDLDRRERGEKDLRRDKCRSPDRDDESGEGVNPRNRAPHRSFSMTSALLPSGKKPGISPAYRKHSVS